MTDYPLNMKAVGDGDFIVRCGMRTDTGELKFWLKCDTIDTVSQVYPEDVSANSLSYASRAGHPLTVVDGGYQIDIPDYGSFPSTKYVASVSPPNNIFTTSPPAYSFKVKVKPVTILTRPPNGFYDYVAIRINLTATTPVLASGKLGFSIYVESASPFARDVGCYISSGDNTAQTYIESPTVGTYTEYTITINTTTKTGKIYKNGSFFKTVPSTSIKAFPIFDTAYQYFLGARQYQLSGTKQLIYDDIKIWNKYLSADEVLAEYNN